MSLFASVSTSTNEKHITDPCAIHKPRSRRLNQEVTERQGEERKEGKWEKQVSLYIMLPITSNMLACCLYTGLFDFN